MKTVLLTLLALGSALNAFAQGTVNFVNLGAGVNAPVFLSDGTTRCPAGTAYTAELLAGTSAANLASIATAGFVAPGYFQGNPATVAIPTVAPGAAAFVQVRVFETSYGSFAAAQASGLYTWAQSAIFTVVTGGAGSPPTTPAPLTGLGMVGFTLVPEPSALALVALGSALLLFRRRRS